MTEICRHSCAKKKQTGRGMNRRQNSGEDMEPGLRTRGAAPKSTCQREAPTHSHPWWLYLLHKGRIPAMRGQGKQSRSWEGKGSAGERMNDPANGQIAGVSRTLGRSKLCVTGDREDPGCRRNDGNRCRWAQSCAWIIDHYTMRPAKNFVFSCGCIKKELKCDLTSDTNLHDVRINVISYIMAFPDLRYLIILFRWIHYVPVL